MGIDIDAIFGKMLGAGAAAFGNDWNQIKAIVPTEFKKLAIQLESTADNVAKWKLDPTTGYPPEAGKIILGMQIRTLEATLTATTALTLINIQNAMNAIFKILKDAFAELVPVL